MMSTAEPPDQIPWLIRRARAGDAAAKSQLFENYRAYLTYEAERAIGPNLKRRCDPSDVVQEVYMAATQGFDGFRGESEPEFSAWIGRILHAEVVNALRFHKAKVRDLNRERQVHIKQTDGSAAICWFEPMAKETTPSQFFIRGERALRLIKAMGELPEDQRLAVRIRYLEGEPLKAVAERMERNPDAVVGLIRRGLTRLRKVLGEDWLS